MPNINTRILHKKDTLSNWNATDPILLDGELAIVDDNGVGKIKIGNGSSKFSELPFIVTSKTPTYTNIEVSTEQSIISIPEDVVVDDIVDVYQNGILLVPSLNYNIVDTNISLVDYSAEVGDIFTVIS